jgi:hypothetical protein
MEKATKVLRVTPTVHHMLQELKISRRRGESLSALITNLIVEAHSKEVTYG